MTIREERQKLERIMFAANAAFSDETKGRIHSEIDPENQFDLRTPYQRDRDRIIHCKSFRRLKRKTQVFLSPRGDHYRTRLTHTLEVAQIARTIARALRLNEDLTEAIALGHDLGHTPFGHAGERALNDLLPKGFRHYEQSLRVVDRLENDGKGLNLTHEVRNGILCHTKGREADTVEGKIVRYADKIAYINHDIDDAIRAGVLQEECMPEEPSRILGKTKSQRITNLIASIVLHSSGGEIKMAEDIQSAFTALHEFLFQNVYYNAYAKGEEKKVPHIIESLHQYFAKPERLPMYLQRIAKEEGIEIAAADYVAGMSDQYAVSCYRSIYIPNVWNK